MNPDLSWATAELLASPSLPEWARSLLSASPEDAVVTVEDVEVTPSYLEFLTRQIQLAARGPAWTQILASRRDALTPHVGKNIVRVELRWRGRTLVARFCERSLVLFEDWESKDGEMRSRRIRATMTPCSRLASASRFQPAR